MSVKIKPGRYTHFKGKDYIVYGIAIDNRGIEYVLYKQEYEPYGFWIRPFYMFIEEVKYEDKVVRRFSFKEKVHKRSIEYKLDIIQLLNEHNHPIIRHSETEEEYHIISIGIEDETITIAPYVSFSSYMTDSQLYYRLGYECVRINNNLNVFKSRRILPPGKSLSITYEETLEQGQSSLEPNSDTISPSSIDLHLSNSLFYKGRHKKIDLATGLRYAVKASDLWKRIYFKNRRGNESITLKPGQTILTRTNEKINLPDDCAGKIEIKSTYARLGLTVTASDYCNPGWYGYYPLTIKNNSSHRIVIHPREKMLQLCLVQTDGIIISPYKQKATYWDDDGTPFRFWYAQTVKRMKPYQEAIDFYKKVILSLDPSNCKNVDLAKERLEDNFLPFVEQQLAKDYLRWSDNPKEILRICWNKYRKKEERLQFLFSNIFKVLAFILTSIPLAVNVGVSLLNNKNLPNNYLIWIIGTLAVDVAIYLLLKKLTPSTFCTLEQLPFESIYAKSL